MNFLFPEEDSAGPGGPGGGGAARSTQGRRRPKDGAEDATNEVHVTYQRVRSSSLDPWNHSGVGGGCGGLS